MVDLQPTDGAAVAERLATSLLDGGARVLQLRVKGGAAATLLALAGQLREITRKRGALLIVNDRLDVALAAAADGVHLGQDDLPLADARRLAPAGFLVGVSTHDQAQAERAAAAGADYLGFGPIYLTRSKTRPDPVVGVDALAAVCSAVAVPVVAIGGITLDTVAEVARAGAAAAAVIAAVNHAPDVTAAARRVTESFASRRV